MPQLHKPLHLHTCLYIRVQRLIRFITHEQYCHSRANCNNREDASVPTDGRIFITGNYGDRIGNSAKGSGAQDGDGGVMKDGNDGIDGDEDGSNGEVVNVCNGANEDDMMMVEM